MKLYDHQQRIVNDDPKKCGLWLGTGSGKTRTALFLAKGSTLVIAPKTQVEDKNWEREWGSIVQERAKEAGNFPHLKELIVISKEAFRRDWKKLPRFDTVIVDEAHTCLGVTPAIRWRNKKPIPKASQLFEALEEYLDTHEPERLYLCTATIVRSPMTVWAAARLLGRTWNWNKFRRAFYFQLPMPGREVWTPKTDNDTKDRLAKAVQGLGYTGRLEDFFDVPEQTYKTEHVDLTAAQRQIMPDLELEWPDPLVRLGKMHQAENGILSGDEFNAPSVFDDNKTKKILDFAVEFPRMVIFAKYRAQIDKLKTALGEAGYKVLTLTGDTKDRGELIAEANASDACIFIAQAQISAGWELPDYPVIIFASMSYSIVDRIQAEGRIHRANKLKKNLYITLVTRGGVDEAVYRAIESKKDFQERVFLNI